ncbi:lipoprotein [Klebsiella pneumoniae subsp. ozaenae]|uniref:Lipoprotein n=1 Tax=Klebsiella pneumoniae subsp. ozaenae TaxID=574 RepID=A0A377Z648_KLEPO|nr:lipoprotein [Klebsiella pneumoniae subsp. ozaenae]
MLLRCLLPLALLPLAAVASAACTLTDPTLTLQSYRVDAQKERIAMYWQDRHGKAWGSLRSLLAGIDGDGRVQMAMNGGIYDKAYAPLGLYIEDGKRLTPVNRSAGSGNFFIRPAAYSWWKTAGRKIVPLPAYKPSPAIRYAVQSGPMLIENGAINWRLKPSTSSRKLRNGVGIDKQAGWCLCSAIARPTFTILPAMRSQSLACGRCFISTAPCRRCTAKAAACRGSIIRS